MIFRQLFDTASSTYTYLLGDATTKEAVIVDPVREQAQRDMAILNELGLRLVCILETHVHADHVTGASALKKVTGAITAVSQHCGASGFDRLLDDGEIIRFGGESVLAISTPEHTPGSTCYLWRYRLLTGDTLLIGGCGRTDFQHGDPGALYDSITQRLFGLANDILVFPGHDYAGRHVSTLAEERETNPRLAGRTRAQFIEMMSTLDLPEPKRMAEAVPANLRGGTG